MVFLCASGLPPNANRSTPPSLTVGLGLVGKTTDMDVVALDGTATETSVARCPPNGASGLRD